MIQPTITVYKGRDNPVVLTLLSDNASIAHASLTRIQIKVGTLLIDSNVLPALFAINANSVAVKLGLAGLVAGRYPGAVIAFDSTNTNGVVFGECVITVKEV